MSCGNNRFYHARASTLVRSSVDFWPNLPASHGLHVYTNAMVGLWFGEFMHPDWDMFQSGHRAGAFHAAARAVSGAPVYVSDKPDGHDFAVLGRLVLSDGSVLRARGIGLPTRDCLFTNPLEEPVLFKVFNTNPGSGVVGVFNARYRETDNRIDGAVSPADVEGLAGEQFAVYLGRAQKLVSPISKATTVPLRLDTLEWEIATIVPVERGFAPIGLGDKLNAGGAVASKGLARRKLPGSASRRRTVRRLRGKAPSARAGRRRGRRVQLRRGAARRHHREGRRVYGRDLAGVMLTVCRAYLRPGRRSAACPVGLPAQRRPSRRDSAPLP